MTFKECLEQGDLHLGRARARMDVGDINGTADAALDAIAAMLSAMHVAKEVAA